MKTNKISLLFMCFVALQFNVYAHTPAESNQVLKVMLSRLAHNAGDDNWDQASKQIDPLINVRTLRDFLMGGQPEGWSYDECRGVFDGYLSCLATNDARHLPPRELYLARIALKHCDTLQYTNAVSSFWTLALNANGVCRERAIKLAVKFSDVNDGTTSFVESIFTNTVAYSEVERETAASVYASMVKDFNISTNLFAISSAVGMFYRNRLVDGVSCNSIDALLCARLPGYSVSSNRLMTVESVLSSSDIDDETRSEFTVITNQLLSSGQPLRWINVGGTSE